MIYIEINKNNEVITQHRYPFDEKSGYGKTKEELEQTGIFVESISEPERIEGKEPILKYNPETKILYYEYVENMEGIYKDRIETLEKQVADLLFLTMNGGN
ncbi:hypothetical protein I7E32_16190 [Alcaligenes faecalis]|uniref:hypothetical protein n=1 Tax=Alcaligenes faecalis TaxID=511 RepID=UPI0018D0D6E9|nr:hypothetical protein [Alcaligenes faecalis]MBH0311912.1 hypothetical protein [Alcaligenes faecalis]